MYYKIIMVLAGLFIFAGFVIPFLLSTNSDMLCYLGFGLIIGALLSIPKVIKFIVGEKK